MELEQQQSAGSLIKLLGQTEKVQIAERLVPLGREFVVFFPESNEISEPLLADDTSKEQALESAAVLLKNGDYVLARNLFSYSLKKDLKDPTALRGLGLCLLKLGEISAARRCFKALWELFHQESSLLFLAQCSIKEKDDLAAIALLDRIKSPSFLYKDDRYEYYKELGNCYTRSQDFEKAEAAYVEALNLGTSNEASYINLGTLELQRDRFPLALFYFKRAVQLNSNNSKGHCGIGTALLSTGELESAKDAFIQALDLDSQNQLALYQLITLCEFLPITDETTKRIRKYLQGDEKNLNLRFCLSALLFKQSDWLGCEKELVRVLNISPGYEKAQLLRKELQRAYHRT